MTSNYEVEWTSNMVHGVITSQIEATGEYSAREEVEEMHEKLFDISADNSAFTILKVTGGDDDE